jgi:tetratricopeptide (TPR) repeat protein
MSSKNKFRKAADKPSISETTERIIVKNRVVFFVVIGVLLVSAFVIGITNYVTTKSRSRGLGAVEDIAFRVEKVSEDAVKAAEAAIDKVTPQEEADSESETSAEETPDSPELAAAKITAEVEKNGKIDAAVTQALADLEAYTGGKGVIAVRANMLKAELLYRDKKYAEASSAWVAAAEADTKAYTAPTSYLNAGGAAEERDDRASAISYYEKVVSYGDYPLLTRALFNLGRVKDENSDFTGAAEAYRKLVDEHAEDSWANIAKSRLLQLQAEGKVE